MALVLDKIIWITDKTGVTLEEYNGKFSIKSVQKYQSQGQDKVSYDWVRRETWNKETRKREIPEKVNAAMGVFLGEKDQAIESIQSILDQLIGVPMASKQEEDSDLPF